MRYLENNQGVGKKENKSVQDWGKYRDSHCDLLMSI